MFLMIRKIIEEVSKISEEAYGSFPRFNNEKYSPVEFSVNNYREIRNGNGNHLAFIDGGNAELISAPGISLQIIRTAAVVMKNNELTSSTKKQFYVLASSTGKKTQAKIFGRQDHVIESTLKPARLCEVVRRASELKMATESLGKATVVLDGTLEARTGIEKSHLEELRFKAAAKESNVVAIAKTTSLLTDKGRPFATLLMNKKSGSWYYNPLVKITSEYHKAEMFFVKLHEASNHVFRAEVFKEQENQIPKIVEELKSNSREVTFPGYPYGLILADKLARVGNSEAKLLKLKMFATAGDKWKNVKIDQAASDAHQILDGM